MGADGNPGYAVYLWLRAAWDYAAGNVSSIVDGWNALSFFEQSLLGLLICFLVVGARIARALEARQGK